MLCKIVRGPLTLNRKGFSTLEYALLATAIVIGLIAAQHSLIRAVSYKWRDAADAFGGGRQLKTSGPGATTISHY
jgi:Flp pilus assembly pilin Flp